MVGLELLDELEGVLASEGVLALTLNAPNPNADPMVGGPPGGLCASEAVLAYH